MFLDLVQIIVNIARVLGDFLVQLNGAGPGLHCQIAEGSIGHFLLQVKGFIAWLFLDFLSVLAFNSGGVDVSTLGVGLFQRLGDPMTSRVDMQNIMWEGGLFLL